MITLSAVFAHCTKPEASVTLCFHLNAVCCYLALCKIRCYALFICYPELYILSIIRIGRERLISHCYLRVILVKSKSISIKFYLSHRYLVCSSALGRSKAHIFKRWCTAVIFRLNSIKGNNTVRQTLWCKRYLYLPRLISHTNNSKHFSWKQSAWCAFILVIVSAVAVVKTHKPCRTLNADVHTIIGICAESAVLIKCGYFNINKVRAVCKYLCLVRDSFYSNSVPEWTLYILCDDISILVICHRFKLALFIWNDIVRCQLLAMLVVDIICTHWNAVLEKLNSRSIWANSHVTRKSVAEIPVWENMHEWLSLIVCPLCTENICTVLCKACCVELTEVGIFRAVWSRLAYVVKACPNELTCTIFCVTVGDYASLSVLCAPACAAVSKGRTLLVIVS